MSYNDRDYWIKQKLKFGAIMGLLYLFGYICFKLIMLVA